MSDPKIINREPVFLNRAQEATVKRLYSEGLLEHTVVEKITYLSDGLKVKGYMARPKSEGSYPVLLWNRGGFRDRGALDDLTAHLILASTAQWGYTVLGTQYRGNMGSEGSRDDWGGKDVDDALNLIAAAEEIEECNLTRVAIEGASRGGMTTYRALTIESRFRCAIVHAGITDLFALQDEREDFRTLIESQFGHLGPAEKEKKLGSISAVYLVDRFPTDCPLLLLHGTRDSRVPVSQTESLVEELRKQGLPHKYVPIDGGGHVALKDGSYRVIDTYRKKWLDTYL